MTVTIEQVREAQRAADNAWRRYKRKATAERRRDWVDRQRIATRLRDLWTVQPPMMVCGSDHDIDIARMRRFIRLYGATFDYLGQLDCGLPTDASRTAVKMYRVRNIPRMATTLFYVAVR